MFYQKFGYNLKNMRIRLGFSQTQIAKVLNVSYQQMQKYETGQNRMNVEYLCRLKHFYGVSYDDFFNNIES